MTAERKAGLGRSSALMASGSLVSRALGFVRNALLVACIGGMGLTADAFQTANTLPNMIFTLLQGGLLTAILLPQITRHMRREEAGREAIDALLTLSFVAVGAVTILATALAGPLIFFMGLRGPALDLGIGFAYLCLPQIFFYGAYAIWSQVLQARDRFGITMWATVFPNLIQIAGMAVFLSRYLGHQEPQRWTPPMVWLLAGCFTLGIAVQAAVLLPALRRSGFTWRPNMRIRGHGFRTAARVAAWMILAVVIAQVGGLLVNKALVTVATRAEGAGQIVPGYNLYTQAFQIFMVPHGIITVSILTALFPRLARSYQEGDTDALRAHVNHGLRVPLMIMLPLTFAAVALAVPGIALVNPTLKVPEVQATALAFAIMAAGLVPYAVAGLQQRYSMAREDGRTNLWFVTIVTAVQIVGAGVILFLPASMGVATIALSQTVGNALAAAIFLVVVNRQVGGLQLRGLAVLTGRLVAASLVPALAAWGVVRSLLDRFGLFADLRATGWDHYGEWALVLLAGGVTFLVLFALAAYAFRVQEITALAARLTGRLLRRGGPVG